MTNFVLLAVLLAAACHASWNALIKVGLDPLSTIMLIAVGAGVVGLAILPAVGLPALASWPYFIASAAINLVYFAFLAESYRTGDFGLVYPIARGSAPLMTALATTMFVGERMSFIAWTGIVTLVAGVFLLSIRGGKMARLESRGVGFALLTALTICVYSVVDGIGSRLSDNPFAYSLCLVIVIAVAVLPFVLFRYGREIIPIVRLYWWHGLLGGLLQIISYGIVLWAMTQTSIAIVATLRETSVLFGAIIAVALLKEPLRATRIAAALLIVCGLALMRLQ